MNASPPNNANSTPLWTITTSTAGARGDRYHWIANAFDPIPFSTSAARVYGVLCAHVRTVGRDPKPRRFDLLIAAVAVDLGIPLITRNGNDFRGLHSALSVIAV